MKWEGVVVFALWVGALASAIVVPNTPGGVWNIASSCVCLLLHGCAVVLNCLLGL